MLVGIAAFAFATRIRQEPPTGGAPGQMARKPSGLPVESNGVPMKKLI
jgi:hypothetical protein